MLLYFFMDIKQKEYYHKNCKSTPEKLAILSPKQQTYVCFCNKDLLAFISLDEGSKHSFEIHNISTQ
jgi:hypothetical protein